MQRGLKCMKGNKMKCKEGCKSETGGEEHKEKELGLKEGKGALGLKNKPNRSDSSEPDRFGAPYK